MALCKIWDGSSSAHIVTMNVFLVNSFLVAFLLRLLFLFNKVDLVGNSISATCYETALPIIIWVSRAGVVGILDCLVHSEVLSSIHVHLQISYNPKYVQTMLNTT